MLETPLESAQAVRNSWYHVPGPDAGRQLAAKKVRVLRPSRRSWRPSLELCCKPSRCSKSPPSRRCRTYCQQIMTCGKVSHYSLGFCLSRPFFFPSSADVRNCLPVRKLDYALAGNRQRQGPMTREPGGVARSLQCRTVSNATEALKTPRGDCRRRENRGAEASRGVGPGKC